MEALFRRLRGQSGFTLVEVMVAASVLIVGLLGTGVMLGHATTTTWSTKAREGAVSLEREVIEAARSVPYDELTPNGVGPLIRQQTGLGDSNLNSAGWTVRRRNITYTVAVGVCSVDDPSDGIGDHDAGQFCAAGTGQTSAQQCQQILGINGLLSTGSISGVASATLGDCGIDANLDGQVDGLVDVNATLCLGTCLTNKDINPADYKRLVVLVRWDKGDGQRWALQSTTVSNPGLSAAPAITSLTAGQASTITSGTSASFSAVFNPFPTTVQWYLDGTAQGAASGSGANWNWTWNLGTVSSGSTPNSGEALDGSYLVGAKGFDSYGQVGAMRSLTVLLNRRVPYPVQNFLGGRNNGAVEFEWSPNAERDIAGYRVYRAPALQNPVKVCSLTANTACRDTNPPSSGTINYYAVAVDRDSSGNLREGQQSPLITVPATNNPPTAPPSLLASTSNGNTILAWGSGATDPDLGDKVDHYNIYRDGTTYADRYDRSPSNRLNYTDTHTNGQQHQYWVTAVDTHLAESPMVGPVTK